MTPVMLRAKGGTRPVALLGSDDEEVLSAALETSTPNRHTLATSKPRTTFNNGAGTAIAANNETSSSSMQSRRYHSKSLSLSEGKTLSKAFETPALRLCTFSGSSQLFQQNRSMWEKRTEPEGNSNGGGGSLTTISVVTTTTTTEADAGGDRNSRNAAPDLVLDLPAPSSSGSSSAGTDNNVVVEMDQPQQNHRHYHHNNPQPGSPDAEEMGGGVGGISGSGADCFAHNQFTLKKNDKFLLLESSRQNFSIPDNNSKEQLVSGEVRGGGRKETSTTAPSSSVLHISEEEEQMQMQQRQRQQQQQDSLPIVVAPETVIAERNTHKFITQFADLKLTGGSLPMPGGGTGTATSSGGEGSASELIAPFKPILRREKPQILRKPVLASSTSSSSSTNSGPSSLLSFCAKGSSDGGGGDDISGTKSLE